MSDTETKTIVGKCVEIIDKPDNDWVVFSVDIGANYPVKLSTKKDTIIEQARGVGGDVATWTFQESDGNENPNKPGTFYKNRWLDKVEAGSNGAQQTATAGGTQTVQVGTSATGALPVQTTLPIETTSEPVDWDAKERRDYRSRAWAQTISAYTHTIKADEEPGDVFRRLLAFQTLVYHDIVRDLAVTDDQNDIPFD